MRKTRLGITAPPRKHEFLGRIRSNHGVRGAEWSSIYGDFTAILRQMGPPSFRPLAGGANA